MHTNSIFRKLLSVQLGVVLSCLSACSADLASESQNESQHESPPNILFIMADDLGYADLSSFGRRDYDTPNIDQLAEQGMRLTSAYSNSPVCSATRTALMTGNYQYRLPIGLEEPLSFAPVGLEPDEPTLPSNLKELGYQTALIGKWHLGHTSDYSPLLSGYDYFWGVRQGGVDYFTHEVGGVNDLWEGDTNIEESGYLTERFGNQAIKQLESFSKNGKPFYLSLHFTAPHWPWEGPNDLDSAIELTEAARESVMKILHFDGGNMEVYAEMVTSLDQQVGRVLNSLKELGLDENTIVVFTSDNGGERFSDNWPFTGLKAEVLEGGIRVPTIVRWPGKTTPGSTSAEPIITMDWVPTFLNAASGEAIPENEFDGRDIATVFDGAKLPERALFWRYNLFDQKALRRGQWKYLEISGKEFLFDVIADPMERGNLKGKYPDVFQSMKAEYSDWNQGMLPYTGTTFSIGLNGEQIPTRYGVEPAESIKGIPPQ